MPKSKSQHSSTTTLQLPFHKTPKQMEATALLASPIKFALLFGGSRSGKTFIMVRSVILRALKAPTSRHVILRLHFNHAKKSIWYDTFPKVLSLCFPGIPVKQNKQDWFYEFENGSQIWIGGLDDKARVEKILGLEYATIYFNEAHEMSYDAVETAYTRLAQKIEGLKNRFYFDCNPPNKRHWLHVLFIEHLDPVSRHKLKRPELYGSLLMNPDDNAENIGEDYITDILDNMSDRKRKRFKEGLWMDDAEGALWKSEWLARDRVQRKPPAFERVVVGVDPAVTANSRSDATGIVCVGKVGEHFYVLDDKTLVASPFKWGREVVKSYSGNKADFVVAEVNQGGDLVEQNLSAIDKYMPVRKVHASRGKLIRAEPVAALSEKGRLHMVGDFFELEEELTSWVPDSGEPSPNRLDALVWACAYMMKGGKRAGGW